MRKAFIVCLLLAGCATTSPVMDAGNGVYQISAYASRARGGAAGATSLAYNDATAYCSGMGKHAVVLQNAERDVYQSSAGGYAGSNSAGSWTSGGGYNSQSTSFYGASTSAAGNVQMFFTCQ